MKRRYSLKRNKEFRYVYRVGKTQRSRSIVLIHADSRDERLLFGFCVSKKLGNAVTRNRVKRRMREAVRSMLFDIKQSGRIILIARNPILDMSFDEIRADIRYVLKKAHLLRDAEIPCATKKRHET